MPALSNINLIIENLSLDLILSKLEKWGLATFSFLMTILSIMVIKQISLLDQFLPTPGGKLLKRLSILYTIAVVLLLLASIFAT